MNSLGSSAKWTSYGSLPSSLSFVLSETEDEADVFSEGEGDCGRTKSLTADKGITFSGRYIVMPPYSDLWYSRSKIDRSKHCPDGTMHPDSAVPSGAATLGSSSATPGDLAFAQKVSALNLNMRSFISVLFFHSQTAEQTQL